ncbi:hypothetical protein AAVH_14371 [Aphelenchoides avenae]|nr:hypothetical protein AAVH_14371 [Aphelenchus avenae]
MANITKLLKNGKCSDFDGFLLLSAILGLGAPLLLLIAAAQSTVRWKIILCAFFWIVYFLTLATCVVTRIQKSGRYPLAVLIFNTYNLVLVTYVVTRLSLTASSCDDGPYCDVLVKAIVIAAVVTLYFLAAVITTLAQLLRPRCRRRGPENCQHIRRMSDGAFSDYI